MMRWSSTFLSVILLLGVAVAATIQAEESQAADEREEYVTTAQATELIRDDLAAFPGKEARIQHVVFPAGWASAWHYHTGDVFVYIVEGEFVVDLREEGERLTFGPGEVYHEAVNTVMQARNPSTTTRTEAYLFQVGDQGDPLMILAE